jgi:hypothetical protein
MSYNMMISYDIYDCFTMEHFRLRQRMTLTTKMYCSRLYINLREKKWQILTRFSRHSTLRLRIFLPEFFFFLILKERKRITVIFFIIALFTVFFFWFSSFVNCILLFLKTISYLGTSLDI